MSKFLAGGSAGGSCRFSIKKKYFVCTVASEDEVKATTSLCEKLGLPGCLGSADCVHVRWDH